MSWIPKTEEIYKHFKGNLYQVTAVAEHSETGEQLVVYQALYGERKIYARPLESFTEELDKAKYPDAAQRYRFELQKEEELDVDPEVLRFLDAGSYREKLEILDGLHARITDEMINTMAISCDVEVPEGDLEARYANFKSCLEMMERFECNRLRG